MGRMLSPTYTLNNQGRPNFMIHIQRGPLVPVLLPGPPPEIHPKHLAATYVFHNAIGRYL